MGWGLSPKVSAPKKTLEGRLRASQTVQNISNPPWPVIYVNYIYIKNRSSKGNLPRTHKPMPNTFIIRLKTQNLMLTNTI